MRLATVALAALALLPACKSTGNEAGPTSAIDASMPSNLNLGAFSLSLSVKDIAMSQAFYEKLGFEAVGGVPAQNWLIMRNGATTIGLFQGLFPKNTLTFNPGWNAAAQPVTGSFTDVRDIQRQLREAGLALTSAADEKSTGPASLMLIDPDGNPILVDQHR